MIEQPDIRAIDETDLPYEVFEDYSYSGFTIPKGFRLDLTSVPRWLWSLLGITPDGEQRPAAAMHDCLYRHGGTWTRYGAAFTYNKKFADQMFRDMMKEMSLLKVHIFVLYLGVRLFGGSSWKKYQPK